MERGVSEIPDYFKDDVTEQGHLLLGSKGFDHLYDVISDHESKKNK